MLTLQECGDDDSEGVESDSSPSEDSTLMSGNGGVILAAPPIRPTAETDMAFYRRKQKFVQKAAELLDRGINLLVVDLHPPAAKGRHGAIGDNLSSRFCGTPTALAPSSGDNVQLVKYRFPNPKR